MKKMMFVAAMAAMVLSSCSKQQTVDDATLTRGAIGFESFVGKTTKGVPVTAFQSGAKMKIYGYTSDTKLGTDLTAGTVITNLDGITAELKGSSWSYSPAAYWVDTKFHSFFAVSPETIVVADGVATVTVANAIADQKDLMVADPKREDAAYEKGTTTVAAVNFTMRHVLSQVLFQAKIAVTDATVTNVKINSITIAEQSAGTFFNEGTVSMIARTTETTAYTVTGQTGTVANYVITPTAAVAVTANYVDIKHAANDVAMLLPQDVSPFVVTANVVYDLNSTTQPAMDITFDAAAITWAPNMKYAYKLNIDVPVQILKKEPITIGNPTIVGWEDAAPAPADPTPNA